MYGWLWELRCSTRGKICFLFQACGLRSCLLQSPALYPNILVRLVQFLRCRMAAWIFCRKQPIKNAKTKSFCQLYIDVYAILDGHSLATYLHGNNIAATSQLNENEQRAGALLPQDHFLLLYVSMLYAHKYPFAKSCKKWSRSLQRLRSRHPCTSASGYELFARPGMGFGRFRPIPP